MTLRVAVDATPIPYRRVGAGVYVTALLRAMHRLDVDLNVFVNARDAEEFAAMLPNTTLHPVRLRNRPARLVWAHSALPLRVRRLRPDVFHGPHYTLPAGLGSASVVTFHDPTFFSHPQLHERSKVAYFGRAARGGIERATRVIAVSDYAGRGAIEHAGAGPDRLDVVAHGVDHDLYRPAVGVEPKPGHARPYILFVGALEPRKDVPTLIGAYSDLRKAGLELDLVLVGPPAWGMEQILSALADAGLSREGGTVSMPDFVPEARKVAYYQGADLFVYPSIAEGFGFPVLEAMACGTPVVTTTGSAPEEVSGGAALLVPPADRAALREAMARVLSDGALAADLRRRGLERAKEFSWDRTAELTLEVYRRAAEDGA